MPKTKTRKFRGSRTCGGGTHKNRRGAGSRGGRGNAGVFKHHVVRTMKRGQRQGKYGFKRPPAVIENINTINVGNLDHISDHLVAEGLAEQKKNAIHIDLAAIGFDKLLGGGKVTKKLIVKADDFSERAKMKLEDAGGKLVTVDA